MHQMMFNCGNQHRYMYNVNKAYLLKYFVSWQTWIQN